MQTTLDFLKERSIYYSTCFHDEGKLLEELNRLSKERLEALLQEYSTVLTNYRPVNFLRYEALWRLLQGEKLTRSTVVGIKREIEAKNGAAFARHGTNTVQAINTYRTDAMFANWQAKGELKLFRVFYTFLYDEGEAQAVYDALGRVADYIGAELELPSVKRHLVGFEGANNYGSPQTWLALYPKEKVSHKYAYQLFLSINGGALKAGLISGSHLEPMDDLQKVTSVEEVVEALSQVVEKWLRLNKQIKNTWKLSPGAGAKFWSEQYAEGVMAINWHKHKLGPLTQYQTSEQLAEALGVEDYANSNEVYNLENFRDASIGDIVVASKGTTEVVGIGVITGEYEFDPERDEYAHRRKMNWVVNRALDFKSYLKGGEISYSRLFRPDTFSPTKVWAFIRQKYKEVYPDLGPQLEALEEGLTPSPALPTPAAATETGVETGQYWWLNANPNIWKIETLQEGAEQNYTSHNESGNKRRVYKYFEQVKAGDVVIGYESSPTKKIKALLQITRPLHQEGGKEVISFTLKERLLSPIAWDELMGFEEFKGSEVAKNNQGSLFKLSPAEYEIIRDLVDERKTELQKKGEPQGAVPPYSKAVALKDLYLSEEKFDHILTSLRYKKKCCPAGPSRRG